MLAGVITAPAAFPVLSIEHYMAYSRALGLRPPDAERNATAELPQDFADMFGWNEMVATVAGVYRSLSPEDQRKTGIFALNYGEAGAIDFLGPRHGLPLKAISPHNSYYLWGPRDISGEILIVIGGKREDHLRVVRQRRARRHDRVRPVHAVREPPSRVRAAPPEAIDAGDLADLQDVHLTAGPFTGDQEIRRSLFKEKLLTS